MQEDCFRVDHQKILIILGEHDIYNYWAPIAIEERKLKHIIPHPKFDPQSFENDLALLQLASPVSYQANILPACIPEDDQHMVGRTGWVTGWGRMKEGTKYCVQSMYSCMSVPRWPASICPARARTPPA